MKNFFILFTTFLMLMQMKTFAQVNLVPNSSFEVFDTCPNGAGLINYAHGWFNANTVYPSTTDYFHTCIGGGGACPPMTSPGYQWPHTGQAFLGMVVYTQYGSNSREYAEIQLISPLVTGEQYYVEFYVALGNYIRLGISNLGVVFTDSILLNNNYTNINLIPQVENPDSVFLTDTLNWTKVSGIFTAAGGENYITIGNFRDDSITFYTPITQDTTYYRYSYYFIDDVSVIPVDSLQGIADINPDDFLIYPNPVKDLLTVKFGNAGSNFHDLSLSDLTGKIIFQKHLTSSKEIQLNLSAYPPGMYFLRVEEGRGSITKKIIKGE